MRLGPRGILGPGKKRRWRMFWSRCWFLLSARLCGGVSARRQKSRAPFGCASVLPTEHGRPPGSAQKCPSTSLQNKRLERIAWLLFEPPSPDDDDRGGVLG